MSKTEKGKFIVFEGIDGSGTSTQSKLLAEFLMKEGIQAVTTCEPSGGPIGNLIREGFKKRVNFVEDERLFDEQMAYLFAADRHDHLYNEIDGVMALCDKNITTISTRYFFSSLAYHGDSDGEYDFVNKLNEKFPLPDLVIYINNPVELSMERIGQRAHRDTYENSEKLTRVKAIYSRIWSSYSANLLIVDGSKSIDHIHQIIKKAVVKLHQMLKEKELLMYCDECNSAMTTAEYVSGQGLCPVCIDAMN